MNRREFLYSGLVVAAAWLAGAGSSAMDEVTAPTPSQLPRWRGFNLLEKFTDQQNAPFRESDFEWIAAWGFDFVRLPLSYWCWSSPEDPYAMDERVLQEIDQAVAWGQEYGVHVNLNLHRAPGYCVNPPAEPYSLWEDERALEACAYQWAAFARRYQGVPNRALSFDPLNEPARVDEVTYVRVVRRLVEAIRDEDPNRLIIADGLAWGRDPVFGLVGLGVAQSTRGYDPMRVSHYRAGWIADSDRWPEPTWPLREDDTVWDKERLRQLRIQPWKALEDQGVGVHVGEWGAFRHTPHTVVLAWMRDYLELWKEAGWGWALWNFRGSFGILDSEREDVAYEDFRGHRLDRKMLELLQRY